MMEAIYAVYTPGKVATTTTHEALSSAIDSPVFNLRVGTPEGIETYVRTFQERFNRPLPTDELVFNEARTTYPDARLRLVTLTREPVSAAVSNWFYSFERNHPGEDPNDWPLEQHRQAIVDGGYAHRRDYFTGWLDFECRMLTGIDVYENDFPIDQGYEVYESDQADLLIVRSESLSRVFREAFRAFANVEVEELPAKNVGEELAYGDVYKRFKENAELPASFIDEQHDTQFATHFYTDEELADARERWAA